MAKKQDAPAAGADAAGADPVGQFEEAMKELETIVQTLERGDLRLDDSLKLFERGVDLTRQCRGSLDHAQLKVRNLLEPDSEADAT